MLYRLIKFLIFFFTLIFLSSCTHTGNIEKPYQWYFPLISRGDSFPSINVSKFKSTLLKLKYERSLNEDDLKNLKILEKEGLIKNTDGKWALSFLSIDHQDGESLYISARKHGVKIADIIEKNLPEIKNAIDKHNVLKNYSYDKISFYVLSDVLLDDVQIENVEENFLNSDRPLRNGSRYYINMSIEDKSRKKESFGIYGNQCTNHSGVAYCLYGNRRYSFTGTSNMATMDNSELKKLFPNLKKSKQIKVQILKSFLMLREEKKNNDFAKFSPIHLDKETPIFSLKDYNSLQKIAQIIEEDLINYLKNNSDEFRQDWKSSRHYNEATFNEYFMWWYHFLYTAATDELAARNLLQLPDDGNFYYLVKTKP